MAVRSVGRITTRTAFAELQRSRARGSSGPVRASFVPVDDSAVGVFPQVGYAVGTRCGNAVTRNTLRRRAREVVRAEAPALARGTYLLRFGPGVTSLAPGAFRHDVTTALHRAAGGRRPGRGHEGQGEGEGRGQGQGEGQGGMGA